MPRPNHCQTKPTRDQRKPNFFSLPASRNFHHLLITRVLILTFFRPRSDTRMSETVSNQSEPKCPVDQGLISFLGFLENLAQDPTLYLATIKNLSDTYTPASSNSWSPPPVLSFDLGNVNIPSPNGPLDTIAAYAKHLLAKSALSDTQAHKIFAPHGLLGPKIFPTNEESISALASIIPCSHSCASKPLPPSKSQHQAEAALLAHIASSPPPASRSSRLPPLQTAAITSIMIEALVFRQATRLQSQPGTTLTYKAGADIKNPSRKLLSEVGGQRIYSISGSLTREVEWTVTEPYNIATCKGLPARHAYVGSIVDLPTGSTVTLTFQPPGEKLCEIWKRLSY